MKGQMCTANVYSDQVTDDKKLDYTVCCSYYIHGLALIIVTKFI